MILSSFVKTFALISGTTNFLVGSILQADELSITTVPTSANLGANSKEVPPPAEKIAISGLAAIASFMLTIVNSLSLNLIFLPTDLSDATGIKSVIGRFLSSKTFSITCPTIPVAPTTATFIVLN